MFAITSNLSKLARTYLHPAEAFICRALVLGNEIRPPTIVDVAELIRKEWPAALEIVPALCRKYDFVFDAHELMFTAVEHGQIESMKILCSWGVKFPIRDNSCDRTIFVAIKHARFLAVRLLHKWADFNAEWETNGIMWSAGESGSIAMIRQVLKLYPEVFGRYNHALHGAAYRGHLRCMKFARKRGATEFQGAINNATVPAMRLLRSWGVRNYDEAIAMLQESINDHGGSDDGRLDQLLKWATKH